MVQYEMDTSQLPENIWFGALESNTLSTLVIDNQTQSSVYVFREDYFNQLMLALRGKAGRQG